MDQRLVPLNGLLALLNARATWPNDLHRQGLRLHLLEAPIITSQENVVADAAQTFRSRADDVLAFAQAMSSSGLGKEHVSWGYDLAIIRLYGHFEALMLEALTCAVNNDTTTISETTRLAFPKHLTDEVCEYLIIGTGYFDFKGREGLCQVIQKFVPKTHYLVTVVKKAQYKTPLEQTAALRNFAAHGSTVARRAAKNAVGAQKFGSAGAWLKVPGRLASIVDPLKRLADDIEAAAPY